MTQTAEPTITPKPKSAKHRSPNYPAIGLRKAVERVTQLYSTYKRNITPVGLAHALWEFKEHSGAGNQIISALKSYGLLEIVGEGTGVSRQVKVSDTAFKIVENHAAKDSLLKAAAISPQIYRELWEKYGSEGLPPDDLLAHYLKFDRNFNPDSIAGFIADFRDTITFAKMGSGDIIDSPNRVDVGKLPDPEGKSISAGDYIQWVSQGTAHFPEPKLVTGKSECGGFVFVEGEQTGFPIADVSKADAPIKKDSAMTTPATNSNVSTPPPNPNFKSPVPTPPPLSGGTKQDVFTTETGELVVRWPAKISEADFEDIEGFLEMLKRKIKRSIKTGDQN